jgi:hypothetical protein
MKLVTFLLILCGVVASAHAAQGQVYKWTDASGIVHYSDAPPPQDVTNVEKVRVTGGDRPHAMGGDAPAEGADADKPKDPADNGLPQPTTMADNADNRVKACTAARNNLDLLNSKFPVAITGSDGKSRALDDNQRKSQIADASAQVALYCK